MSGLVLSRWKAASVSAAALSCSPRIRYATNIRLVESSQHVNRLRKFRFDALLTGVPYSFPPGIEIRAYFHSKVAYTPNSANLGGIESAKLGGSWVHLSDYKQVFAEGAKLLKENPYAFLKHEPNFKSGEIPFDGATAGRDGTSEEKLSDRESMNWVGYYTLKESYAGGDEDELDGEL